MNYLKISILLILTILLTGCTFSLTSSSTDLGVFKSFDYAEHWEQKNFAGTDKNKELSIAGVETKEIVFDPQDHSLVYLATRGKGLFVSENGGEKWQQIFKGDFFVSSMAPDFQQRGVLYVAVADKVYKSIDLGKNWRVMYIEPRPETEVVQVAVAPHNSSKLIISTSRGEILISQDAGESWNLVAELKDYVRKILINPQQPSVVYAASLKRGIFKSTDGGLTWINLKDNYTFLGEKNLTYRVLVFDPNVKDGLIFATGSGIIKTSDGGQTWQALELLTPAGSVLINALAVNPQNSSHIYYATENTIYRSFDGGQTWLNARVPSKHAPIYLAVDPATGNVVYLGILRIKKKPFFLL